MKRSRIFLAASLVLNSLLAGHIVWVHLGKPEGKSQPGAALPLSAQPAVQPFRWAQVESSDYPTYIANLRGLGCPEQTIRELIAADLDDLFAPRRAVLVSKLTNAGSAEHERVEGALTQLRQEETSVFRKLFNLPEPVENSAGGVEASRVTASVRLRPAEVVVETNATMPLVFQPVDTNSLDLTDNQVEALQQVRQSFQDALGTDADVNSAEYLARWQKAQKEADSLLDALIGRQALLRYRSEAERLAAETEPGSSQN
jgi:hypothetical protein